MSFRTTVCRGNLEKSRPMPEPIAAATESTQPPGAACVIAPPQHLAVENAPAESEKYPIRNRRQWGQTRWTVLLI